MSDAENIFNDDEFFGDTIDKPSEDIEQHENRKCLQNVLRKLGLSEIHKVCFCTRYKKEKRIL